MPDVADATRRRRGQPARQAPLGEPYFTPGRADRARHEGPRRRSSAGDLAVVRPGRGRARVERSARQRPPDRERARGAARRAGRARRVRAVRAAAPRASTAASTCASCRRSRSTRRRRRTSTTRSRSAASPTGSAPGCTSPTSRGSSRPARRSTAAPPSARSRPTCPGLVAPMLPHELADDACSLRPHQDRLCVTVEMPPDGEPLFYRSVINSRRAAHLRRRPSGARRRAEILEQLDLAAEVATRARARRGSRAARSRSPRPRSRSRSPTAASRRRGARASRTRTCSSRS